MACFLCAAACPADCIYIEAAENTDTLRISGGERYAKVYNIDYTRCIFCGYCVEACPTDAITHGHGFEIASYNTSTLIYRKEQMLAPIPEGANFPLKAETEQAPAGPLGPSCAAECIASARRDPRPTFQSFSGYHHACAACAGSVRNIPSMSPPYWKLYMMSAKASVCCRPSACPVSCRQVR